VPGVEVNFKMGTEAEGDRGEAITNSEEHPKGFRLAIVILALVLSVFLVALDLVHRNHD
jgi:hypothetical protein